MHFVFLTFDKVVKTFPNWNYPAASIYKRCINIACPTYTCYIQCAYAKIGVVLSDDGECGEGGGTSRWETKTGKLAQNRCSFPSFWSDSSFTLETKGEQISLSFTAFPTMIPCLNTLNVPAQQKTSFLTIYPQKVVILHNGTLPFTYYGERNVFFWNGGTELSAVSTGSWLVFSRGQANRNYLTQSGSRSTAWNRAASSDFCKQHFTTDRFLDLAFICRLEKLWIRFRA